MKSFFIIFLLPIFVLCSENFAQKDEKVNFVPKEQETGQDMVEIVNTRGYNIETHNVTTKDGYILTLFRIPGPKTSSKQGTSGKYPVLLQHGFLDSSYTWVNNYADQSLAFVLVDAGFDVWLGNNRGNKYSQAHESLNPDDGTSAFWDFTYDEMGLYDTPAFIHHILDTTGSQSLSWVGHSEGTTQLFAAGSYASVSNDEYLQSAVNCIDIFIALAPVAFATHQKAIFFEIMAEEAFAQQMYAKGFYEFLPYGPLEEMILPKLCQVAQRGCNIFLMTIMGPTNNLNTSRLQLYMAEFPSGSSMLNTDHWAQAYLYPDFQMYDFGVDKNQLKYGSDFPPKYDLSLFNIPTAFYSGGHDFLADSEDVELLLSAVPASTRVYENVQTDFNHMDFVWSPLAKDRIYASIVDLIQQYSK